MESFISAKRVFFYLSFFIFSTNGILAQQADVEIINQTFLGNWERNYYGSNAPDNLKLVWKHYLGEGITVIGRKAGSRKWKGAGWTGQPLMVREGLDTFLIQGAYDHHLKKINALTGDLVWQYKYDDVIKGTGTIWENSLAVEPSEKWLIMQGSRLGIEHFLDADEVYSFRAVSYSSGNELWRHNVKLTKSYSRDVDASALLCNDTAYIGLENSFFTVFNPNPDDALENGLYRNPDIHSQLILYNPEDVTNHKNNVVTEASPCMIGRMIYVASGSGHIWGYDMDKKELTWDFFIGSDIDGSPIVTDDNRLLISIEKQYIAGRGGMLKLDPSKNPSEAVDWFFPVMDTTFASWEGGIIGSIGITDSYNDMHLAACMAMDGNLYVVKHDVVTGDSVVGFDGISKYPTPLLIFTAKVGPSISTPVFTENKLLACGYGGIHLFSYTEGGDFEKVDKLFCEVESTPYISNGHIFIASRNGYLYCLGKND